MNLKYLKTQVTDDQIYLFCEGTNYQAYHMLGAHFLDESNYQGVRFNVWAPNANWVSVVGDFNNWNHQSNPMININGSGIWELFIPGLQEKQRYKYAIGTKNGETLLKYDPYAYFSEVRPNTASIVYNLDGYNWNDEEWQINKSRTKIYDKPLNIYEVHLGSWRRNSAGAFLTYRELADELVNYVCDMGYTHIELMPIYEHPLDESWGYQVLGYYAATSRFGEPKDLMYFIDCCHRKNLGVILDWVPGHFPKDAAGLAKFDGTALYEHSNPIQGEHPQWGTLIFNYSRNEVQSFLISNAMFWLEYYHVDGFRVDAVASMLYLDFEKNEWIPNKYGGRENLEAVDFMRDLNKTVFEQYPNTLMIAEESSAWPQVTQPTNVGGLGYNYKWNMGWMNDILRYVCLEPSQRRWHHNLLTFSIMYTYSENFILPLSHDEVVHGKCSLLNKMPGDYWNKFAGLRTLFGYMMAHPGKKLLFMGGEFGQFIEWKFDDSLDWHLLGYEMHNKMHTYVKDLNHFYLNNPSLWELDHNWDGYSWIDANNNIQSIISFVRKSSDKEDFIVVAINFTNVPQERFMLGVPNATEYLEVLNSDDERYGGSGVINEGEMKVLNIPWNTFNQSIEIRVPPLGIAFFKPLFLKNKDDTANFNDSVAK